MSTLLDLDAGQTHTKLNIQLIKRKLLLDNGLRE